MAGRGPPRSGRAARAPQTSKIDAVFIFFPVLQPPARPSSWRSRPRHACCARCAVWGGQCGCTHPSSPPAAVRQRPAYALGPPSSPVFRRFKVLHCHLHAPGVARGVRAARAARARHARAGAHASRVDDAAAPTGHPGRRAGAPVRGGVTVFFRRCFLFSFFPHTAPVRATAATVVSRLVATAMPCNKRPPRSHGSLPRRRDSRVTPAAAAGRAAHPQPQPLPPWTPPPAPRTCPPPTPPSRASSRGACTPAPARRRAAWGTRRKRGLGHAPR